MIWHNLKSRLTQTAVQIVWGNVGLTFFGFAVPMWFLSERVDVKAELGAAMRMLAAMLRAFWHVDFGAVVAAALLPFGVTPFWFAFGRYGLVMCLTGAVLLALLDLLAFAAQLRAHRVQIINPPSEAEFEDPDKARRRMGRH